MPFGPTAALPVRLRAGRQRSPAERGTALLLPALALTGAIVVGPFLFTVLMAFNDDAGVRGPQGDWGIGNLQQMLADPLAWQALRITGFLFVVCLAIETTLGLLIALVLQREVPGRRVLEALVLIPSITASVAVAMMWLLLMQPNIGLVNGLLDAVGISGPSWLGDPSVAPWAIVLVDVWQWTPFMALILVAGLRGLPEEPLEAALVDGATGLQRLLRVVLPMLWPVVLVAVLLRSIDLLRFFDTVYILTQGGPINSTLTLNVYGYRQGFNFLRIGYAAILQLTLLVIVAVFAALLTRLQKRASDAV